MGFEVFKGKGKVSQGLKPNLAIHPYGRLSLNEAAFQALGRPDRVLLYYDGETDRIAVGSSREAEPYSYPVIRPAASNRWAISASAFTKEVDLHPRRAVVVPASIATDGLLVATASAARNAGMEEGLSGQNVEK